VLPLVIGISKALAKVHVIYCTSVKTGLTQSMITRLGHVSTDAHYVVSTAVDPRFKLKWVSDVAEVYRAKILITAEIEKVVQVAMPNVEENISDIHDEASDKTEKQDDLLSFMRDESSSSTNDQHQSSSAELDGYIATTSSLEPLIFWSDSNNIARFPRLHQMHLQHHSVPATSAAMERVFSSAGYIVSARRSSRGDDIIEKMLLARCNRDFL
jgi:hypothetical protein